MSIPLRLYKQLSPVFRPFGMAYGRIMHVRREAYRNGSRKQYRPACPVVAVGNIRWGGTGKTPIAGWLLNWALEQGLRAVVLSRGYKGRVRSFPLLVGPSTKPDESGDEPLMLAGLFPEARVLVDPKRARAAKYAEERLSPDLFILDDGFQHLALARDCDIVLLTPEDMTHGWNRVIPSGTWREGASALRDAHIILLRLASRPARQDLRGILAYARQKLENLPFFPFYLKTGGLRCLGSTGRFAPNLGCKPYHLFCGTGNPSGVLESATGLLGYPPLEFTAYKDHYDYTVADLLSLQCKGIDLVCTEKDAIKLEACFPELLAEYPVWAIQAQVEFLDGLDANGAPASFEKFWADTWRKLLAAYVRNEAEPRGVPAPQPTLVSETAEESE